MIVENQIFEIKITRQNINWYQLRGYKCKLKDIILVNPEDLTPKNSRSIQLICDYCGKEFTRRYADHTFINSKKNSVNKDACKECNALKFKDVCLFNYGVENTFQLEEIKDKIKQSNINTYGVENPMQCPEVVDKLKSSNMEKYGVDNPSKSQQVKQKIVDTMQERYGVDNIMELSEYRLKISETLSKNQSVSTSKQQIYLNKLFNGTLNYSESTPILDIAFPEQKIYVEYNGGGHKLKVIFGLITEEEFRKKELKRYHYLKDLGWKAMFIDSVEDFLPSDNVLNHIFNIGYDYLQNNSWIKFDIDNKKIISKNYKINFDYGKLRRIKDKDLEEVG